MMWSPSWITRPGSRPSRPCRSRDDNFARRPSILRACMHAAGRRPRAQDTPTTTAVRTQEAPLPRLASSTVPCQAARATQPRTLITNQTQTTTTTRVRTACSIATPVYISVISYYHLQFRQRARPVVVTTPPCPGRVGAARRRLA